MRVAHFFAVFTAILILSLLLNYALIFHQKKSLVVNEAKKIDAILSENFDQLEKVLIFIGKRIANDTPDLDPKIIHQIFVNTANTYGSDNILSWSLFDWVNADGYQTVNTMFGVRKDGGTYMASRNYRNRANKNQTLIFSEVAIGIPSGVLIIPAGVQIETKKSQYAGTITVGINIKKLVNIIMKRLDNNFHFAVIDKRDDKFAFGSYEVEKYFGDTSFKRLEFIDESKLIFKGEMKENYPYRVVVRYDQKEFWHEVIGSSLKLTLQIMMTVWAVIFFRKRKA